MEAAKLAFTCILFIFLNELRTGTSQGLALGQLLKDTKAEFAEKGSNVVIKFGNWSKTWDNFLSAFNKSYKNADEAAQGRARFQETLKKIEDHNKRFNDGNVTFWMAVNEFSDWTPEEKSKLAGTKIKVTESSRRRRATTDTLCMNLVTPASVDWRNSGSVTAVKNQRKCGSCWAFSVAGAVEGQRQKLTNESIRLSEQQMVDCDTNNNGCDGGDPAGAFAYLEKSGGIMTENSYPYTSTKGYCAFNASRVAAKIKMYTKIAPSGSECALRKAVAEVGPISMAAHITDNFYNYGGGVFSDDTCQNGLSSLNHAMLIVGYGTENQQNYWIVKNSWGSGWGEDGYIRMTNDGSNQCGVASYALYPQTSARNVTDSEDGAAFIRPALFCIFFSFIFSLSYSM